MDPRVKRIYAVLNDIENTTAKVIYKNDDDPVWYVFTSVVDVDTAIKISDALNREQRALTKENQ